MSDDEFDAGAAAQRAMGDVADVGEDVAEMVDDAGDAAEAAAGSDPAPDGDSGGGDGGDGGDSSGVVPASVTGAVRSLFLAPERGPSQQTFAEAGVDEGGSLVLDGTTDWLLDVVDVDDVGDTLGPAGKVALGMSKRRDVGDGGGGDGGGSDEAADQEGSAEREPDAVSGVPGT